MSEQDPMHGMTPDEELALLRGLVANLRGLVDATTRVVCASLGAEADDAAIWRGRMQLDVNVGNVCARAVRAERERDEALAEVERLRAEIATPTARGAHQ